MIRLSFRQTMLAGFLTVVLFLGWAGLRGWFLLEQFSRQSRANNEQFLQLSALILELAERTTELERSARQYQVLSEPAVLARFDMHAARSLVAIERLESLAIPALAASSANWRKTVDDLARSLRHAVLPEELQALLVRLGEANVALETEGRLWIDAEQTATLEKLEAGQLRLGQFVGLAVLGAFLIALILSWWLSRPIGALEHAIRRLGDSRFDEPIVAQGPSDLRRVGQYLEWLRQRLSELEADRERTLRHVSHELKTPLTALREGVALLQEEIAGPLEDSQREVVEILHDNAMILQGRIEGLLHLNAMAQGARRLRRSPVSLERLLREVVQERELQIQSRQLRVQCEAPASVVMLDVEKLRVVLDNLLSNAIDFSPERGRIRLRAALSGQQLNIACRDEGPGVAAEDAERIFEPFVQGKRRPPTPRQGSGVGLSIVRELVAVMGGNIFLKAIADESGAHFEIELPCRIDSDQP